MTMMRWRLLRAAAAECTPTIRSLWHAVLNHLGLVIHRWRQTILHVIGWSHSLLLIVLLLHLLVVRKISAGAQVFLFLGRFLHKVLLAQQSRSVKRISELAFKLFPVEYISDLVWHIPIWLEQILPLSKRENAGTELGLLKLIYLLGKLQLIARNKVVCESV